jgi:hypothetical protein
MNLVIDIATNRIVFYAEEDVDITAAEKTIVAKYIGQVPVGMTAKNCWQYRLVGKEIVKADKDTPSQAATQFEINKKNILSLINSKCEAEFKKLPSRAFFSDIKNELDSTETNGILASISKATGRDISDLTTEFRNKRESRLNSIKIIEFIKNRFVTAVQYCKSLSELDSVKKSFEEAKFTNEYINSTNRDLIKIIDTNIDVSAMLEEVKLLEDNWAIFTKRQNAIEVQKDTETIPLIRGMPISGLNWPESLWDSHTVEKTDFYSQYPTITTWLDNYTSSNNLSLSRVALVRLKVGGEVLPHIDVGEYYRKRNRYHLCIEGEYTYSVLAKTELIRPGTLMQFDNKNIHSSTHIGNIPRIAIIFDAEPLTV